jgi:hypothetical protein
METQSLGDDRPQGLRVLVCGSRRLVDRGQVWERIDKFPRVPQTEIITGDARGADDAAYWAARCCNHPVRRFSADWKAHGKRAGIIRNLEMLDEQPDLVVAFWDGESRGTRHTIAEAERRGIPVEVIRS